MAEETWAGQHPDGRPGLLANFVGLAAAMAHFVESRLVLIAHESKAALFQLFVVIGCILAAVVFFAFGYLFLIVTAVVALAHIAHIAWVWIALGAAVAHFLLALVCSFVAQSRMTKRPFPVTRAELKKDREWILNLDETTRPMS
jgi:uncharacterized membrane protein YqjE